MIKPRCLSDSALHAIATINRRTVWVAGRLDACTFVFFLSKHRLTGSFGGASERRREGGVQVGAFFGPESEEEQEEALLRLREALSGTTRREREREREKEGEGEER